MMVRVVGSSRLTTTTTKFVYRRVVAIDDQPVKCQHFVRNKCNLSMQPYIWMFTVCCIADAAFRHCHCRRHCLAAKSCRRPARRCDDDDDGDETRADRLSSVDDDCVDCCCSDIHHRRLGALAVSGAAAAAAVCVVGCGGVAVAAAAAVVGGVDDEWQAPRSGQQTVDL